MKYLIPSLIARLATNQKTWEEILQFHGEIATDHYVQEQDNFYRTCIKLYGESFFYLDIVNVIYTLGKLIQPRNYLEVGVRRGRSCCVLTRACPNVDIFAFDMWLENYAGMTNPGPELVRSELAKNMYTGKIEFIDGNSHETLPKFFHENHNSLFDMVTIDGDHSEYGARLDLRDTIQRVSVGGAIIFDDISHPSHPWLYRVWIEEVKSRSDYVSYEYIEHGYGVAFAIRIR